jgi:hypothetical protein
MLLLHKKVPAAFTATESSLSGVCCLASALCVEKQAELLLLLLLLLLVVVLQLRRKAGSNITDLLWNCNKDKSLSQPKDCMIWSLLVFSICAAIPADAKVLTRAATTLNRDQCSAQHALKTAAATDDSLKQTHAKHIREPLR